MSWTPPTDGGDANTWGSKLLSSLNFLKNFVDVGATKDFATSAASTARTGAVADAKAYVDPLLTSTRSGAVADAKTYTDSAVAAVNKIISVPAGTTTPPAGTAPGTLVLFLS